jgi:hypothetical protein
MVERTAGEMSRAMASGPSLLLQARPEAKVLRSAFGRG